MEKGTPGSRGVHPASSRHVHAPPCGGGEQGGNLHGNKGAESYDSRRVQDAQRLVD